MPCFSGSPFDDYEACNEALETFFHVVDFYYRKNGVELPTPPPGSYQSEVSGWWWNAGNHTVFPEGTVAPLEWKQNHGIIQQIALHVECDGLSPHHTYVLLDTVTEHTTLRRMGYAFVLGKVHYALRGALPDPDHRER